MPFSMRRLLVIGAGFTGVRVALRAAEQGADVTAITRDAARAAALEAAGVAVRQLDAGALEIASDVDVVYSVPPIDAITADDIVDLARRSRRFVYLSSTGVYGDHQEAVVDEASPRRPTSPDAIARMNIEDALFAADVDALIVRIVGIYGPGRTIDEYIARGRYTMVDGGAKLTNRIHVDDLAEVVAAAIDRAPRGPRAYIASDGAPVRVGELVQWVVDHTGVAPPPNMSMQAYRAAHGDAAAERWSSSYTASNGRMLAELGVELRYPTVFDGYRAILGLDPTEL